MLSSQTPLHPVLGCARTLAQALDEVAQVNLVYLSTAEKRDALLAFGRVEARVQAIRLQLLAVAEDVAELTAARTPGEWAAHELRLDPREGRRDQALATALETRYPHLGAAMRHGHLQRSQAEVIRTALDALPTDLPTQLRSQAEQHLLAQAQHFTPARLRVLGHKLLETIDPALAEDYEQRLLQDADERAAATTKITFRRRGDGTTDIHARVPDHIAARLKAYLEAYTNPHRHHPTPQPTPQPTPEPPPGQDEPAGEPVGDPGWVPPGQAPPAPDQPPGQAPGAPTAREDTRCYPRRLGAAFCTLLEAIDTTRLPLHGGDATTLVITLDHDRLRAGTGHATLPDGTPLSPAQTRRLACMAAILPVVLGAQSQPLDLGRTRRLFSGPIRRALNLRDKTCRAAGCDHPGAWCEAHHKHEWVAHHGATRLEDGVLLCSFHHHRAHDPRYHLTYHPNGDVTLHLRT